MPWWKRPNRELHTSTTWSSYHLSMLPVWVWRLRALHHFAQLSNNTKCFPLLPVLPSTSQASRGIATCFFTQILVPTLVLGTGKPGSSPALQNPVGAGGWKWSYHLFLKERRFCLALESCLTRVSGAGGLLAAALLPPVARWKEQACWPACSPAEITSSFPAPVWCARLRGELQVSLFLTPLCPWEGLWGDERST